MATWLVLAIVIVGTSACRVRKREPAPEPTPSAVVTAIISATVAPAPVPPPAPPPEPVEAPEGALVVVIGGADSEPTQSGIALRGVDAAVSDLVEHGSAIDAVAAAIVVLEDAPLINAGTGSVVAIGASGVNMDAAIADSNGRFGAVAGLRRVKNPVKLARLVADTPQLLVSGEGAEELAARWGLELADPVTTARLGQRDDMRARLRETEPAPGEFDWRPLLPPLPEPAPDEGAGGAAPHPPSPAAPSAMPTAVPSSDTAIAIVRTAAGEFAAAASTGGPLMALPGRSGDVPIFGAAIFVGKDGAVAVTGRGETITRLGLAQRIYEHMKKTRSPDLAAKWGAKQLPGGGVAVMNRFASAIELGAPMAWAKRSADKVATGLPAAPTPAPAASSSTPTAAPSSPPAP